mgnify:CR=1 FL=1
MNKSLERLLNRFGPPRPDVEKFLFDWNVYNEFSEPNRFPNPHEAYFKVDTYLKQCQTALVETVLQQYAKQGEGEKRQVKQWLQKSLADGQSSIAEDFGAPMTIPLHEGLRSVYDPNNEGDALYITIPQAFPLDYKEAEMKYKGRTYKVNQLSDQLEPDDIQNYVQEYILNSGAATSRAAHTSETTNQSVNDLIFHKKNQDAQRNAKEGCVYPIIPSGRHLVTLDHIFNDQNDSEEHRKAASLIVNGTLQGMKTLSDIHTFYDAARRSTQNALETMSTGYSVTRSLIQRRHNQTSNAVRVLENSWQEGFKTLQQNGMYPFMYISPE